MIADHIIEETDTKRKCVYCNNRLEKNIWASIFEKELHYKTTRCKCGKELRIRVNFCGSGHDSWDGNFEWIKKFNNNDKKEKQTVKKLEPLIKELKRVDKFQK